MRKTLFRGKTLDGRWEYGYYVRTTEENDDYSLFEQDWIYDDEGWCRCGVIPETVGQYTGLDDKSGAKIFEGDIVSFLGIQWDGWNGDRVGYVGIVRYSDEHTSFNFEISNGLLAVPFEADDILIIGNIHDSPELMEPTE